MAPGTTGRSPGIRSWCSPSTSSACNSPMTQAGKVAVVTGSSKGIGYAIAEALVRAGASVMVSARHAEEVSAAAARLNALGKGRASGVPCDVRRPDAVAELIRRTVAEFGGLDIQIGRA